MAAKGFNPLTASPQGLTPRKPGDFAPVNERGAIMMATTNIMKWPKIDPHDPQQVGERLDMLFSYMAEQDLIVLPSTMALALGVTIRTLDRWRSGQRNQDPEVLRLINAAYDSIMSTLQLAGLSGRVQVLQALAIQHSMGMQDNPDKVQEAVDEDDRSASAQEIMMKYQDMPDE